MLNVDPSLPVLTTEQIQQCLEENKELIMAILEGQNQGNLPEIAQYQAKLQHNLTFLAKLADTVPQEQATQKPPMYRPRPDHPAALNSSLDMNEQQQQQQHSVMSQPQSDPSTAKLPFQMNEQQHQYHKPAFSQQHQVIPDGIGGFQGYPNSGMQTRLFNQQDMPSTNLMGSEMGLGWS